MLSVSYISSNAFARFLDLYLLLFRYNQQIRGLVRQLYRVMAYKLEKYSFKMYFMIGGRTNSSIETSDRLYDEIDTNDDILDILNHTTAVYSLCNTIRSKT